jgi:S1-C subfamily serine protease
MRALGGEDGLHVRQHDGRVTDAELAGWDPATGLAVLQASALEASPLVPSANPVRVGHVAVALARSWSNSLTASLGIVAVIGGPLRTGRRRTIDQVFRMTAPMHEGFAGGAVLDADGRLTGIATAASIRGLGLAIPASIVGTTAAAILEHGHVKRGYLGIAGQPVRLPEAQRSGAAQDGGVLVVTVMADGPAAAAGMLVGDVLLAVDQAPLDSPEQLMDLLAASGAGHKAHLRILRGGAVINLDVTMTERPAR